MVYIWCIRSVAYFEDTSTIWSLYTYRVYTYIYSIYLDPPGVQNFFRWLRVIGFNTPKRKTDAEFQELPLAIPRSLGLLLICGESAGA